MRSTSTALVISLVLIMAGCSVLPTPVDSPKTAQPVISRPPASMPKVLPRLPRIGLALGGGAARGFAHIGVLQVLEEQGIKVDLLVGTSAGSLVATLYASGRSGAELGQMAEKMDESTISDWIFPGRALLRGEALARYVRQQTGGLSIENMKRPLGIVATDLQTGEGVLFQRGDPGVAVRASSSVPAIFEPTRIGEKEYVDGGLVAPVPVQYARQMGADIVVAVDISAAVTAGAPVNDAFKILLRTFDIMGRTIKQYELKSADIIVKPKLSGISSNDFSARRLSIMAGREAMLTVLPHLKEQIALKTH